MSGDTYAVPSADRAPRYPSALPATAVHLWLTAPGDLSPAQSVRLEGMLASDERARSRRFVRDGDREPFIVAHAQLRLILSLYEPVLPDRWVFSTTPRGRPFIGNENVANRLHFSLSHVNGLVAIAVSRTAEIGVDVEHLGRRIDRDLVADRVFTSREAAWFRSGPDPAARFATLWTLKEAYSKARGEGLSMDFRQIEFRCAGSARAATLDSALDDHPRRWAFISARPTPDHCCAVAVGEPAMLVRTFDGAGL